MSRQRLVISCALLGGLLALGGCAAGGGEDGDCGNGRLDPGEQCDGLQLGGFTCESLGAGFTGGTLGCTPACTMDTTGCTTGAGVCGNGVREAAEVCDGMDLASETCESLGLGTGSLACLTDCSDFDMAGCDMPPTCGNGVRDGTEQCDGLDLGGSTCEILGHGGGTLSCQVNCLFDETGCTATQCGNGVIETGEQCDGADLGGQTCQGLGYAGGTLVCGAGCQLDESGCSNATCGDGTADPGEECDGSDLGGETCVSQGFAGGTLGCSTSCTLDTSGCSSGSGCALLPYSEGFENSVPPTGGTHVDGSGFWEEWESSTVYVHGGSYAARHYYDFSETDNDVLVLPCLDLQGYTGMTVTLTFWQYNSLPSWYEGHYVVSSTATSAPSSVSSYSQVVEVGAGSASWTQYNVDLSSLAGQPTVWIGFRYYGTNADSWYIDDVSITAN